MGTQLKSKICSWCKRYFTPRTYGQTHCQRQDCPRRVKG